MDSTVRAQLAEGARAFGELLDESQLAGFETYLSLLQLWNQRINLTAIRDPRRIVTHHFLDSIAVLAALRTTAVALGPRPSVIDVGSGAGFPGVVMALLRPAWRVVLVERVRKKVSFLVELRRALGLSFEVRCCDVSEVTETFDVAVSRAAFPPAQWIAHGQRLVRPGGLVAVLLQAAQLGDQQGIWPGHMAAFEPFSYEVDRDTHAVVVAQKAR